MDQREAEVAAVLQTYFDGLYHSDSGRLREVFHPLAHYVTATEAAATGGEPLHLTMAEYFPIVDARPSPASRNEPRRDRIVSLAFAGPVTACARVECAIGPKFFTDLLTLVKVAGRWQIISKVFHFDLR
ncbi:MAG: nuclear transport factor 2 family protein [Kiloniellaceae bacterium]